MIYHSIAYIFIVKDTYINQSCDDSQTIHYDSRHDLFGYIISRIHRMLALVVAYTTLQSQLPMGFILPLTRLAFKYLRSPATLTTLVGMLYVRLTNSLECQDAILT